MNRQILIEQTAGEIRAAVLENEKLIQFQVQPAHRADIVGNIYQAVVRSIKPSLDAAFVDIGLVKHAFLPARDLPPALVEHRGKGKALQDVLRSGQTILVQALREAVGEKGTMVTGNIVLPGRFLVLTPGVPRSGVSRRLSDKERDRLHKILTKVKVPEGTGVIVRTAGEDRTQDELEKDLTYLLRLWKEIEEAAAKAKGPHLLYREGSLPIRFIREFMTPDVQYVRTNNDRIYQDLGAFVNVFAPRWRKRVLLETSADSLFRRYRVEDQMEQLSSWKVPLPSGGTLVIDHTEALVAIDVNTAKIKGKDHEETIYKTNIEAASEVARQMVLRDIGGLVVVDFIDMDSAQHRSQVEKTLRQAFSQDKARIRLGKISEFGLMEISRQQLRPKLEQIMNSPCPRCSGTGFIKSTYKAGSELLLRIRNALTKEDVGRVVVEVPPDDARYLLNERRRELVEIEDAARGIIEVQVKEDVPAGQARIIEAPMMPVSDYAENTLDNPVLSMYSAEDIDGIAAESARLDLDESLEERTEPDRKPEARTAAQEEAQPGKAEPAKRNKRKRRSRRPTETDRDEETVPEVAARVAAKEIPEAAPVAAPETAKEKDPKRSRRRRRTHRNNRQEKEVGSAPVDGGSSVAPGNGMAPEGDHAHMASPVQLPLLNEES